MINLSMSQKQQVSFPHKVPENYEMMHTQYLLFNEYTKLHNKSMTHEQLKKNIKALSNLSQNDDLLEYEIEDDQDQMVREFYQRLIQKSSRSIEEKKIEFYLNKQKNIGQNSVKMDDLKLNFKNLAILSANYRKCFQSFFDTEEKIQQQEDIDILDKQRFAFQLEFNKLDKIYPGQALFILEELRPKVIGRKKRVGAQSNQKQSQSHPQLQKGSQQMEFQQFQEQA